MLLLFQSTQAGEIPKQHTEIDKSCKISLSEERDTGAKAATSWETKSRQIDNRDVIPAKRWNILSERQSGKLVAEGLLIKMPGDESLRNAQPGPALPRSNAVLTSRGWPLQDSSSWSNLQPALPFLFHPCFRHSIMNMEECDKIPFPAMKISPCMLLVVWYTEADSHPGVQSIISPFETHCTQSTQ